MAEYYGNVYKDTILSNGTHLGQKAWFSAVKTIFDFNSNIIIDDYNIPMTWSSAIFSKDVH